MTHGSGRKIEMSLNGKSEVAEASDGSVSISMPIQLKRCSGRQQIRLPDGSIRQPTGAEPAPTPLQQALARGYRWLYMLESGEVTSLKEIAKKEKLDSSYISRMTNLTMLAPDIIDAILTNQIPPGITLFDLSVNPPGLWTDQRIKLGFNF